MRSFLLLLMSLAFLHGQAQNSSFTRVYPASSEEKAVDFAQLSNGDHYMLSTTATYGAGGQDILLTRTNGLGEVTWSFAYGTSGDDQATSLLVTNDGGVLITGYTDGVASGTENGVVLKVTSSGSLSWNRFFYNDSFSRVYDAVQNSSGGLYIVGTMYMDSLNRNAFVSSLTSTGNVLWSRTYGGERDNEAFSIGLDAGGRYVIAGYTENDSVTGGGMGDRDIQIMRLAASGSVIWSKNFGTNQAEMANRILVRGTTYYVAGQTEGGNLPGQNMLLLTLDTNANVGLSQIYGSIGDDEMHDIAIMPNGDINMVGRIQGSTSASDIALIGINSSGVVLTTTILGGDSADGNWNSRVLASRETGSVVLSSGKSFLNQAQNDLYLIKTEGDNTALCGSKLDLLQDGFVGFSINDFVYDSTLTLGTITSWTTNSVTLSDTSLCCQLEARVAADTLVICSGDQVRLGKASITGYSYSWTTNNSSYTSSSSNPQVSPDTTTTYKLVVSAANGECTPDSAYIVVKVNPRLQGIDFARDSFFCENGGVQISAYPGLNSYSWAGNGYTLSGRIVNLSQQDTLVLTVIDNNSCIYKDTVEILEIALPRFSLGPDTTICENLPIRLVGPTGMSSYTWNGSTGTDSVYITSTQQIHSLSVVDPYGCTFSDQIVVQTKPYAVFSLGPDTGFCAGGSFVIQGPGALSNYIWNDTASSLQNLRVYNGGSYHLTAFNSFGCPYSDTISISEYSLPSFSLGADTGFCPGNSVVLQGPLAASYLWSDGSDGDQTAIGTQGTHWLRITDGNGCSYTDTVIVLAYSNPDIDLGKDTTICYGDTLTLNAGTFAVYAWGGGESTSSIRVSEEGSYRVRVTDENGCFASDTIQVDTMKCGTGSISQINGIAVHFYPNPTDGHITISSEYPLQGSELILLDMAGRELLRQDILGPNHQVDLRELRNGTYQISIQKEGLRLNARIVVQH